MRWLINYLRQCFCKHEFQKSETYAESVGDISSKRGMKVSLYCPKCGYHKSFWKF